MNKELKLSDFFPGVSETEIPIDYCGYIMLSRLIAYDSKTGKVLFNTACTRVNYSKLKKYLNATVLSIRASVRTSNNRFNTYIEPVIECYLLHDSWK